MKLGVELYDPTDHPSIRKRIEERALKEFSRSFPQTYGGVRLEVDDLRMEGKDRLSIREQKKAILANRTPARSLRGTLRLFDSNSGELLDERPNFTLMRVPFYTDRGTFIYNGNEYTGVTQLRMIPGAYTRRQTTGGLETQFNTRVGTGSAFRVGFDPEEGQFRLKVRGSNLHLYSILKDLGVPDETLAGHWGEEVLAMNRDKYDSRAMEKARQKMVPRFLLEKAGGPEERAAQMREALNLAQVSKGAVGKTLASYWVDELVDSVSKKATLRGILKKARGEAPELSLYDIRKQEDIDDEGDEYMPVGVGGLIAATRKLLAVNRGLDVPDNRNHPVFLKAFPLDKLLSERIRLDDGNLRKKIMRRVAARKKLDVVPIRAFDDYHLQFITKNPLTSALEEINPLHLLDQHKRLTQMGPGGIGSMDAVTDEMRNVQAGEFGFLCPLEGPESSAAGVDTRLAWNARFGSDGRIYQQVLDRRTGKEDWVSPEDLFYKTLKV